MRTFAMLAVLLVVFCGLAAAQENSTNPIDAAMKKCLEINKATMPRAKCYSAASEAWQKDVDEKYKALLKLLPAPLVAAFKTSQSDWIKYRDAHVAFLDAKEAKQKGTGHIAGRIIERMQVVKQRALILDDLYESYQP